MAEVVTPERLSELAALCENATPGPWEYPKRPWPGVVMSKRGCLWAPSGRAGQINHEPDAEFIAAARSAVPELLAEVARLTDALAGAEALTTEYLRIIDQRTAEREDLRRLLGSHADGHRCTCTCVDSGVYFGSNIHPSEWEQDPWCPTHPDVDQIRQEFDRAEATVARVTALRDKWEQLMDVGVLNYGTRYSNDLTAALGVSGE